MFGRLCSKSRVGESGCVVKPTRRQRKAARLRLERGNCTILRSCCRKLRYLQPRRLTRKEVDRFVAALTMPSSLLSLVKVVPMDEPLQGEEAGAVVSDLRAQITPEDGRANITDSFVYGNAQIEVHRDVSGKVVGASHVPFQVQP